MSYFFWDVPTSGRRDVRTSGRPDVRTSGRLDVRTAGRRDVRTSGRPDVRTSGRPDIRTSGRPDVRTSGRRDVWTSGRPDVPTSWLATLVAGPTTVNVGMVFNTFDADKDSMMKPSEFVSLQSMLSDTGGHGDLGSEPMFTVVADVRRTSVGRPMDVRQTMTDVRGTSDGWPMDV